MALLRFDLPLRPLAGLYARIVRRELGIFGLLPPRDMDIVFDQSLFARSVAVALGQSFAGGDFVRKEFAQALSLRLPTYDQFTQLNWSLPFANVAEHANALVEIVAQIPSPSDRQRVEIVGNAEAEAVQTDYQRLLRLKMDALDYSPEGPLGPIWQREEPPWWRLVDKPDRWVTPLTNLCAPIWSSKQLSEDSFTYLVNFGLDRIESNPGLIERWTETVYLLLINASRPGANIRNLVDCCRTDP